METPGSEAVSTRQRRIARLASEAPQMAFTTLNHHVDLAWLHAAYLRTRKDGAVGTDGMTAAAYAENLEANLRSLLERAKSGMYRAPAVRRVEIPKGNGETRPIGIPAFEDKVLQRAIVMLLEPIYEHDFKDCSYGFRPRRSAHQALAVIRDAAMAGAAAVLDVDIRKFFDTLNHGHLREFVKRRVRDGVVLRLIGKWLNAGVMEDGAVWHPEEGTPQGGVISPLLANIYLHYVLDEWFEQEVKPRLASWAKLIRYADDFVIVFRNERDAERVLDVLPKRMGRFGLSIHPEKTRLVPFRRPRDDDEHGEPGSFDFLGFTHYWCRSRKGNWVVKRRTAASRLRRSLRKVTERCRAMRHQPIRMQHVILSRMIRGHRQYYGITGNSTMLSKYHRQVERIWRKWLSRRSAERSLTWDRFKKLLRRYPLPPPTAVHSILRT